MKLFCRECRWHGQEDDALRGINPFDGSTLFGCPQCMSCDPFEVACDEPDCWRPVSCGTPLPDGRYRQTCSEHAPWRRQEASGEAAARQVS